MKKTFKEKWNSIDEVCPACKQVTKENRGLTKQNFKKLFRKPSIQDIMILIMITLILIGSYTYKQDVGLCQQTLDDKASVCALCKSYSDNTTNFYQESIYTSNLNKDNLTFINITDNNSSYEVYK